MGYLDRPQLRLGHTCRSKQLSNSSAVLKTYAQGNVSNKDRIVHRIRLAVRFQIRTRAAARGTIVHAFSSFSRESAVVLPSIHALMSVRAFSKGRRVHARLRLLGRSVNLIIPNLCLLSSWHGINII